MRSMFLDKLNKHWKEKWNEPNNDIGLYGLFEEYMILNLLYPKTVFSVQLRFYASINIVSATSLLMQF